MNFKKYIYELLGFIVSYGIVFLIFEVDSTTICFIAGVIGAIGGKFISKLTGFFIDEIIDHKIVNKSENKVDVEFTLKADYKTRPVILYGSYSAKKIIDNQTLFRLLYDKLYDNHYKQVLKSGLTSIIFELKEETVEVRIKNKDDKG